VRGGPKRKANVFLPAESEVQKTSVNPMDALVAGRKRGADFNKKKRREKGRGI